MSSNAAARFSLGDTIGRTLSRPFGNLLFLARISGISFVIFAIGVGVFGAVMTMELIPILESLPDGYSEAELSGAITLALVENNAILTAWSLGLMALYYIAIVPPYVVWIRFITSGEKPKGLFHFSFGSDEQRVLLYMIVASAITIAIAYLIEFLGSRVGIGPTTEEAISLGPEVYAAYPFAALIGLVAFFIQMWLYARWIVAPVVIVDKSSRGLGMMRSWSLTRGAAFKLFFLLLITVIIVYLAMMVFAVVGGVVATIVFFSTGSISGPLGLVLSYGVSALFVFLIGLVGYGYVVGVMGSASAEAYAELGGRVNVAEIFD